MTFCQYTVQIPWSIAASQYSLAVIGVANSHFNDFIAAVTLLRHRKSIRGRATLLLRTDPIQSSVQEWRRYATPSCIASNLRPYFPHKLVLYKLQFLGWKYNSFLLQERTPSWSSTLPIEWSTRQQASWKRTETQSWKSRYSMTLHFSLCIHYEFEASKQDSLSQGNICLCGCVCLWPNA